MSYFCAVALSMFGVSSFLGCSYGRVWLVGWFPSCLCFYMVCVNRSVSLCVCVVQQQKLRIMNACPQLQRKTTVVLVCVRRDILTVYSCTHTYETSQKHGSPHLDDVRLSSQPACCFSPPCGCFPIQLGDPGFSCKLMQVLYTGHCSSRCSLTITGR